MLTIRKEQMEALGAVKLRGFEDRTYAHLQKYFPRHCQLIDEKRMRRVIRQGWEKATGYGLTIECCVRTYIEFMCLMGSGYDTDPLLPWAGEILQDQTSPDQIARADRLYHKGWDYVNHIARDYRDPSGEPITDRFVDSIKQLRRESNEILHERNVPEFSKTVQSRLSNNFPAKFAYVGEDRVRDLIPRGIEKAQQYEITTIRGVMLVTVFMWVLGDGFDRDLLLPWASEVLNDETLIKQNKKVDKLFLEGVDFLRTWWEFAPRKTEVDDVLG